MHVREQEGIDKSVSAAPPKEIALEEVEQALRGKY